MITKLRKYMQVWATIYTVGTGAALIWGTIEKMGMSKMMSKTMSKTMSKAMTKAAQHNRDAE
jgi:hypothetical protein